MKNFFATVHIQSHDSSPKNGWKVEIKAPTGMKKTTPSEMYINPVPKETRLKILHLNWIGQLELQSDLPEAKQIFL